MSVCVSVYECASVCGCLAYRGPALLPFLTPHHNIHLYPHRLSSNRPRVHGSRQTRVQAHREFFLLSALLYHHVLSFLFFPFISPERSPKERERERMRRGGFWWALFIFFYFVLFILLSTLKNISLSFLLTHLLPSLCLCVSCFSNTVTPHPHSFQISVLEMEK